MIGFLLSVIFNEYPPLICICSMFWLKGTVQRDFLGGKWYKSIGLSLKERHRDCQLILTVHSHVRGPLSFHATTYGLLELSRQFPITVPTSCSSLFLNPILLSPTRLKRSPNGAMNLHANISIRKRRYEFIAPLGLAS